MVEIALRTAELTNVKDWVLEATIRFRRPWSVSKWCWLSVILYLTAHNFRMAPTRKRAYMLAWLFSMQAFGYATATITSIIVVNVVRHYHPLASQVAVDQIWRWVVGLSLIPAAIAVVMRCFVPESPRFTLYILNYPFRALQDADVLNQAGVQQRYQDRFTDRAIQQFATNADKAERDRPLSQSEQFEYRDPVSRWTRRGRGNITIKRFWEYLHRDGNGWKLAVTASTWFLLDFVSQVFFDLARPYLHPIGDLASEMIC